MARSAYALHEGNRLLLSPHPQQFAPFSRPFAPLPMLQKSILTELSMSVSRHAFSLGSALVVGSTTFSAEVHAQAANWTFSYVGAVAGYDWNNIDVDGIGTIDADGFAGGAVAGINFYQSGNLVLGVEADIMWIDGSGSTGIARRPIGSAGCRAFEPNSTAVSADVNWKASVRGRAGYLATPVTLVYATAGVPGLMSMSRQQVRARIQCLKDSSGACLAVELKHKSHPIFMAA